MKQPYIYTMPESFLKDKSVPARWRVLGVINGFILNGGCFYGSNEWLMEQLGCSQHTISTAFTELEELGEIRSERTKRTRRVYKTSKAEIATNFYLRPKPTAISDSNQLLSNSVSNSVKNTSALEDEPREVVFLSGEGEEREPRSTAKYPHAKEVFSWFPKSEPSWNFNTTERKCAELLYARGEERVRRMFKFIRDNETHEDWKYSVVTPYDLETKWAKINDWKKKHGL